MSDRDTYTFGDGDIASRRLAHLAVLYEPETRALVARAIPRPPSLALDLGCGPGWSTRLVHEVSRAPRTVGIDASERYIAEARRRQPALEFVAADIARALPISGAELIVSRFVLTHLARPADALTGWAECAAPDARLALHENESFTSSHPALIRYYQLVGELQAHHGQALYMGAVLDVTLATTPWRVVDSRAIILEKPAAVMAELHVANLRSWRNGPFARDHFDPRELDELDSALDALMTGHDSAPPVENLARQVVAARD